MACMRSASILASALLAAIAKLSLGGEAIVKLGLQSEVCSSRVDDASMSLLQNRGRGLAAQGSPSIHAGDEAPSVKALFIRTHFTGSSTLAMIMRRYCEIHNKTCSPRMRLIARTEMLNRSVPFGNYREWRHLCNDCDVDRSALVEYAEEHRDRDHVQFWVDHVEYDPELKRAFDLMIPGAVKVSLFREPMARLMSGFSHDWMTTEMVQQIVADLKSNISRSVECGAMSEQVPSLSDVDVVGMTEDFERSLVLIAMRLGWDLEDVLYLPVRESPEPSPEHQQALDELKALLQKPLSTLPEASREFVKKCYLDDLKTFHAANRTYHKQLASLTPDEHVELEKRVARLHFAFETLTTCCEEAPTDQYCNVMKEEITVYPQGWLESPCRRKALMAIRA